jgi:serine/threonine-protein kinase
LEKAEWSFDANDQLGPAGGFGEVFRGRGQAGDVAVKRLKLSAGAASHREMKIGAALANRLHKNIVPTLDYGQDADSDRYYLVMPLCDHSLQDALNAGAAMRPDAARAAALDIVSGLLEVQDIVHRDLKPGNVLWHEGQWKIADFGIAKFVEDATSLESLRRSLTPMYAAPEQWLGERPTNATDVYALGCMIHAMLTGAPPFPGSTDDVREAHLHKTAPSLSGADSRLAGLVATMLRKSPESRPSLARCATVISSIQAPTASAARAALAVAGHAVSQEEAAAEAANKVIEDAKRERNALADEANSVIRAMIGRLFDTIETEADSVQRTKTAVVLGPAHLTFHELGASRSGPQERSADPFQSGWDAVAYASLTLRAHLGNPTAYDPGYYMFGASLVFARIPTDTEYRWRELSFHENFSNRSNFDQPFALSPYEREFQVAVSKSMGNHQVAYGPLNIDAEDEDAFQERWVKLFAKAARRKLVSPNQLPLPDSFFS